MVATENSLVKLSGPRSKVSISTGENLLPIEVTVTGKLPIGAGRSLVENALQQQRKHEEYLDEYNEPSALIGRTTFEKNDPTAVYTFGVDHRDLVFHRHEGHRVITGITGGSGCLLKFSLCTVEEAITTPQKFVDKLFIVRIPADRMFVLRFSGTVYHQFCPVDPAEDGFFAVSTHTNEAAGLTGEILQTVLANQSSIPLLTEPAPSQAMQLLETAEVFKRAVHILIDID